MNQDNGLNSFQDESGQFIQIDNRSEELNDKNLPLENSRNLIDGGAEQQASTDSLIQASQNFNDNSSIRDGKVCKLCPSYLKIISILLEYLLNSPLQFKNITEEQKAEIVNTFLNRIKVENQDFIIDKKSVVEFIKDLFPQELNLSDIYNEQSSRDAPDYGESNFNDLLNLKDQEITKFNLSIIPKEISSKEQSNKCQALCFNHDDNLIATAKHNLIIIWKFEEVQMGQTIAELNGHKDEISCLLFDKDSDTLISGGGDSDCQINIWKSTKQMIWELKYTQKLNGGVKVMFLNKKRDKLFIGTQKGQIVIFEVNFTTWIIRQSKIQVIDYTQKPIFGLSLNEDENYLVSCGQDQYLRLFKIDQEITQIADKKCNSFGMRIKFIDNSNFVLNQRDGKLIYYKIEEKRLQNQQSEYYLQSKQEFDLKSGKHDHSYTPIWSDQKKKLFIVKHNTSIHFFKYDNRSFYQIGQLDQKHYLLFATVSNSGRYLITWVGNQEKQQYQGEKHNSYQIYEINQQ